MAASVVRACYVVRAAMTIFRISAGYREAGQPERDNCLWSCWCTCRSCAGCDREDLLSISLLAVPCQELIIGEQRRSP